MMAQKMQALVANQTIVQGTSDSGTMIVESRYLKNFLRHKPLTFDGGKVDPVVVEMW